MGSGGEEICHHSSCALIGDSDQELHILFTLCKEETCCAGLNVPETENCLRSDASRHGLEERSNDYIVMTLQRSEVRSTPRTKTVSSQTPCQTVAVYSREAVAPRLSWDADRAWYVMESLLVMVSFPFIIKEAGLGMGLITKSESRGGLRHKCCLGP